MSSDASAASPPPGAGAGSRADQRLLLSAAADLIAERGYRATTIEQIVRRAGVGDLAFYEHFDHKEGCLLALLDASYARAEHAIAAAYASPCGPWPDRLAAALRALFEQIAAAPALARVCLIDSLAAGPAATARYRAALAHAAASLRAGRELRPPAAVSLPETTEIGLLGGTRALILRDLTTGEAARLPHLLPGLLQFFLIPYLGFDDAQRFARKAALQLVPTSASSPPASSPKY